MLEKYLRYIEFNPLITPVGLSPLGQKNFFFF